MTLRARILRDLLNGQSTVRSMALRFDVATASVQAECDELEIDLLISASLVGGAFSVFRLTPSGRDEAALTNKPASTP